MGDFLADYVRQMAEMILSLLACGAIVFAGIYIFDGITKIIEVVHRSLSGK